MDWSVIITAIITAGIPAVVTLVTSGRQKKLSKMHSAKQSILQMMMEDVIAVEILHKLPVNHTNIHYEYDEYKKNGGNSDIDKKMKEYGEWFSSLDLSKTSRNANRIKSRKEELKERNN